MPSCFSWKTGAKRRFATSEEALIEKEKLEKQYKNILTIYKCGNCGFWHIGSDRRVKR